MKHTAEKWVIKLSHSPALPLHGLEAQAMCHFNQKDVLLETPQKL